MNYLHGCNGKYSIQVEECFAFLTSLVFLLLFLSWIYVELRGHFSKEYKQVWATISHVFWYCLETASVFSYPKFFRIIYLSKIQAYQSYNCQWVIYPASITGITQRTFVGLQDVLRLQRDNFSSSKTSSWRRRANISWRRLVDALQTCLKTSWRRLGWRKIVTRKTSWRSLEDMSWAHLKDISWRRLGGTQNVYWRYLYLTKAY